jgi:hypothetical protein
MMIDTHPTDPDDAIVKRAVTAMRVRESFPAINQPYQDTLPENSSGDA